MGRPKGVLEKPRVEIDMRPKYGLETIPIVIFSKEESSHSRENLKRMYEYLRKYKVQAEWYPVNCDGEMVLLALIDSQHLQRIRNQVNKRSNVRCSEWAPVEGGESLRQNIPLQTLKDLIQHNNPNESYRIYIVSENATVFYVGQADNPISRLCERLNPFAKKELFTTFLRTYIDDAYTSWRFQLLTLQDCESLVVETILARDYEAETIKSEVIKKYRADEIWAKIQAENVLIWRYRPCLNEIHNPFPMQLPAKYSDFSVSYSQVLQSP